MAMTFTVFGGVIEKAAEYSVELTVGSVPSAVK